jgi:pimeloyl-ACP methyl ester carboxylesterase
VSEEAGAVQSVDLNGSRIAYREWGSASGRPPIVLVHGITSSALSWIRVGPRLAERTRVIAVDLKGHGDSGRPESGYRVADQAREIAQLCGVLQLGEIDLVGHSLGGGVSLQLAVDGRVSIRRLVLEDAWLVQGESTPEQRQRQAATVGVSLEAADAAARPSLARGWSEADVAGKVDAAVKGSPSAIAATLEANANRDQGPQLAQLTMPTLFLRAESGSLLSDETTHQAHANPLITVVTVSLSDHNIHRGQFEAFMAELAPFLGD